MGTHIVGPGILNKWHLLGPFTRHQWNKWQLLERWLNKWYHHLLERHVNKWLDTRTMIFGPLMKSRLNKWHHFGPVMEYWLNKWHCVLNKWHLLLELPVNKSQHKVDMIIGPIVEYGLNKLHLHGLIMGHWLTKWQLLERHVNK